MYFEHITLFFVVAILSLSPSLPQTLTCEATNTGDLNTDQTLMVTVHLGNLTVVIGEIEVTEPVNLDLLIYLVPAFALVIIVALVIFIVVVVVFCRKSRQKDRRYDQLILELEKLESSVARECKLGEHMVDTFFYVCLVLLVSNIVPKLVHSEIVEIPTADY